MGSKHLRIAGLLEILLGAGSIALLYFLLGKETEGVAADIVAKNAFGGLMLLYVLNGFKILAGLLGILLAGRKSILTVILGLILFIIQLWNFVQVESDMVRIVINIVLLAIPYYYLHNAYKVYRNK